MLSEKESDFLHINFLMAHEAEVGVIDMRGAAESNIYLVEKPLLQCRGWRRAGLSASMAVDATYTKKVFLDPFNSSCNSAISTTSFFLLLVHVFAYFLPCAPLSRA